MKVFSIASLKGGVGKSTLTIFLAQSLAKKGKNVLVIDLDPNNSLTDYYLRNYDPEEIEELNSFNVLGCDVMPEDAIYQTDFDNISIIPATIHLHKSTGMYGNNPNLIYKFRNRIQDLNFDIILIDTPPSLTYELRAGITASDIILSPVAPIRWVRHGLDLLKEEIENTNEAIQHEKKNLNVYMIPYMVSKTDMRIIKHYPEQSVKTMIPKRVDLKTRVENAKPLSVRGKSILDFNNLSTEIIKLME